MPNAGLSEAKAGTSIALAGLGKKFAGEWVFRGLSYRFEAGKSYAVIGNNGSGKSTLLKIAASYNLPSEGVLSYMVAGKEIAPESVYRHISISAPYTELVEEFTLWEHLEFHARFKNFTLPLEAVVDDLGFAKTKTKTIKDYSSGMKQKVKLALCFFSDSPILLLDEPCSNFDSRNIDWYLQKIAGLGFEKLLIVCSNQSFEHSFCTQTLSITDYKKVKNEK